MIRDAGSGILKPFDFGIIDQILKKREEKYAPNTYTRPFSPEALKSIGEACNNIIGEVLTYCSRCLIRYGQSVEKTIPVTIIDDFITKEYSQFLLQLRKSIPEADWNILEVLSELGEAGTSDKQFQEVVGLKRTSLLEKLSGLEKYGYVKKRKKGKIILYYLPPHISASIKKVSESVG